MSVQDENRYQNGILVKDEPVHRCLSCNVPWAEHLGVQGTCKELQEYKASHARLVKALEGFASSEGNTEYGCTYCGDRRHDAHRCTSGGSHDFEPIGTIHHFDHREILAARQALAEAKALTGEAE